jgi:hypothetical protein
MSSDLRPGPDSPPTDELASAEAALGALQHVLGLAHKVITPQGRATVGFDDPVAVPDDASALDRLIAFTGRDPAAARA